MKKERAFLKDSFKIFITVILLISAWVILRPQEEASTEVHVSIPQSTHKKNIDQTAAPTEKKSAMPEKSDIEKQVSNSPGTLRLTKAEFHDLTSAAQKSLPRREAFRKISMKEAHGTPSLMQDAGTILGQIAQALHDNPSLSDEASDFYQTCLARSDLPDQIRALCLANHRSLRLHKGERPDWSQEDIQLTTETIRDLAEQIPTE